MPPRAMADSRFHLCLHHRQRCRLLKGNLSRLLDHLKRSETFNDRLFPKAAKNAPLTPVWRRLRTILSVSLESWCWAELGRSAGMRRPYLASLRAGLRFQIPAGNEDKAGILLFTLTAPRLRLSPTNSLGLIKTPGGPLVRMKRFRVSSENSFTPTQQPSKPARQSTNVLFTAESLKRFPSTVKRDYTRWSWLPSPPTRDSRGSGTFRFQDVPLGLGGGVDLLLSAAQPQPVPPTSSGLQQEAAALLLLLVSEESPGSSAGDGRLQNPT